MGFELWYSKTTGIRRKGTTFSEIQNIFVTNITTNFIYEPLACCQLFDNSIEVYQKMESLDFDILGVANNGSTIGFVRKQDIINGSIESNMKKFDLNIIISDSTPISELLDVFSTRDFAFVLCKNEIAGIITKADINKPIVRIYLFGIISLYELHINYWVNRLHENHSWQEKLKANRMEAAKKVYDERKGNNEQLTLLECLQISDKKEILRNSNEFLQKFNYTNKGLKDLLEKIAKIRNELAHSQNSIISNLKWDDFIGSIKTMKDFLSISEKEIIN